MNKEELGKRIIELIAERGFTEAKPTDILSSDLGIESLDRFEIEIDLEAEFNIRVPGFASEEWITVDDIIKTVMNLLPITKSNYNE